MSRLPGSKDRKVRLRRGDGQEIARLKALPLSQTGRRILQRHVLTSRTGHVGASALADLLGCHELTVWRILSFRIFYESMLFGKAEAISNRWKPDWTVLWPTRRSASTTRDHGRLVSGCRRSSRRDCDPRAVVLECGGEPFRPGSHDCSVAVTNGYLKCGGAGQYPVWSLKLKMAMCCSAVLSTCGQQSSGLRGRGHGRRRDSSRMAAVKEVEYPTGH